MSAKEVVGLMMINHVQIWESTLWERLRVTSCFVFLPYMRYLRGEDKGRQGKTRGDTD